jgi:hypothetical protein
LLAWALLEAFDVACKPEDNFKINEILLYVINLASFDELTSERSETIIEIIDLFESEMFGGISSESSESSEWSENLRPTLLSFITKQRKL